MLTKKSHWAWDIQGQKLLTIRPFRLIKTLKFTVHITSVHSAYRVRAINMAISH